MAFFGCGMQVLLFYLRFNLGKLSKFKYLLGYVNPLPKPKSSDISFCCLYGLNKGNPYQLKVVS